MSVAKAERQRKAIHLSQGGLDDAAIARQLKVKTKTVQEYLRDWRADPRKQVANNIRENLATVPKTLNDEQLAAVVVDAVECASEADAQVLLALNNNDSDPERTRDIILEDSIAARQIDEFELQEIAITHRDTAVRSAARDHPNWTMPHEDDLM